MAKGSNLRRHLSWIKNQVLLEPLNKGRRLHYLKNYFVWHLFYKHRNKRWIIEFDNGLKSIVYPYPDHDAGEINIWTRNVDWHELEFIRKHLNDGDSIVDAGCNVGNRTLALADKLSNALLIDAGEVAARRTRENLDLNKLHEPDFVVVNKAVGEEAGVVHFTNKGGASTLNMVVDNVDESNLDEVVEIELTTIDIEVQKMNIQPGFIKTDVEGQDLKALKGAINTLKSGSVKLVMFEHNKQDELQPLLNFFNELGWEVLSMDKHGNISVKDEDIANSMNLFARPGKS